MSYRSSCDRFAWLVLFLPLSGCMCSSAPSRLAAPSFNSGAAGAAAVAAYDKNSNGKIELAEMSPALKLCVKDKSAGKPHDTDGDNALSAAEITARIDSYLQDRVGLTIAPCVITLNGKPLAGATLTFVPEPFLADTIQPASGTTDSGGMVVPKVEGKTGLLPGLYKIEISKKDASGKETLPANYNTQTELGREIAQGIESLRGGTILIDLAGPAPTKK